VALPHSCKFGHHDVKLHRKKEGWLYHNKFEHHMSSFIGKVTWLYTTHVCKFGHNDVKLHQMKRQLALPHNFKFGHNDVKLQRKKRKLALPR
jgi:hypothetical protein